MLRRPPVRIALLLAVVLFAVGVLGVGLFRAAFHEPGTDDPGAAGSPAHGRSPQAARSPVPEAGPVSPSTGRCGPAPTRATRELRGMWLTTVYNIDFPSRPGLSEEQVQAEYLKWLDVAVAHRHNAIFVHVRPSGDAFWPSAYAPWSQWLTGRFDGRSPGWDPMPFMIEQAHARNLEFHAWFNPYRGTQPAPSGPGTDLRKVAPGHPLLKNPQWRVAYPTGETGRLYFDPGVPQARRFVEDAMLEAVRRYDIDGVHFDDFFYPYPEKGEDFPDDRSYARYGGGKSRADWRRDNVNTLVREMSERLRELKPHVKFGISPFGIWRNRVTDPAGSDTRGLQSYDAIYADTRTWVREGWLDYVVPQLYWTIGFDKADYAKALPWWADLVRGTDVQLYIGQADYRVGEKGDWSDPAELDRQLALNDRHRVQGQVHFSAKSVRDDPLGAVARYRDRHYATPALVPTMDRLPARTPGAPRITGVERFEGAARTLRTAPGAGEPAVGWALYRVDGGAANLVATGRSGTAITDPAPPKGAATYCLSGLDRSGNEGPLSEPFTADPA